MELAIAAASILALSFRARTRATATTLYDYLPDDCLLFIDESHVSVPQIRGMYKGDRSRKETLVEYGFHLPSALDNRPLRFGERMSPQTVFMSATPGLMRSSMRRRW